MSSGWSLITSNEDRNPLIQYGDALPVDLIAWLRLAVSSQNVAIYNSSDYIVRQTIINFIIIVFTTISNNYLFFYKRFI